MKKMINKKGFTLIESVIAIVIIGVIGVIMADILGKSFDNTEKTSLISNIQQNGQAALNSFEDSVRYSKFVCVGGKVGPLTTDLEAPSNQVNYKYHYPVLVVKKDNQYVRFRIVPQPQTNTTNGYILEDYPSSTSTEDNLCNPSNTAVNGRFIVSPQSKLSVKSGAITLLTNPLNPQLTTQSAGTSRVSLTLTFAIGPAVNSSTGVENNVGLNNQIEFNSTAQFR